MASRAGYRELLGNRRYLVYQSSAFAANVGYSVYAISVPWLALELTGSLVLVGFVVFIEVAAYALTFLGAPWVDRARDKRTVFLATYPFMAVLAAVAGLGISQGWLSPGLLLALVAAISLLWDFPWAAQNIVPRLLLPPDQLFRAEGLSALLSGATQVGGFSLGGVLVIVVGPAGGMYLYAAMLVAGAVLASLVSLPAVATETPRDYWGEFRAGWRFFSPAAGGALDQLAIIESVRGFFYAAPILMITAVAERDLGYSASAYSWLFVLWVVGSVAAGLVLGELNPRRRVGGVLLGASLAQVALFLLAVPFAARLDAEAIVWLAIGACGAAYLSAKYVYLQGAYPPEVLGRVSSNLFLFTGVSGAFGAVTLGYAIDAWSLFAFALAISVGMAVIGGLIAALPRVRRAEF